MVCMPVKALTVAEPPTINMRDTKMFVAKPKTRNTMWAKVPYRALIISRYVWALGARLLSSMARVAKRRIWTVAPDAYQNGPDTPYR
jgi:hypothetical protein